MVSDSVSYLFICAVYFVFLCSSGRWYLTSMVSTQLAPTMVTPTCSWSASTSTTTRLPVCMLSVSPIISDDVCILLIVCAAGYWFQMWKNRRLRGFLEIGHDRICPAYCQFLLTLFFFFWCVLTMLASVSFWVHVKSLHIIIWLDTFLLCELIWGELSWRQCFKI